MSERKTSYIYTCRQGSPGQLMADVARLYFHEGDIIADVTAGLGSLWTHTDLSPYTLRLTDIWSRAKGVKRADLRRLPYADRSIDVVVLDPPFHRKSPPQRRETRQQFTRRFGKGVARPLDLYAAGIDEACRVLKRGGRLVVKCQDQTQSDRYQGQLAVHHVEVLNLAKERGFVPLDLFVLHHRSPPTIRHAVQRHARKNHSFLWVFIRTSDGPRRSS